MKHLYAPWRSSYTEKTARTKQENIPETACVFCTQLAENNDEKNFIVKRFKYNFILLNRYPYNAGHLLILPFQHINRLDKLSENARSELMELTNITVQAAEKAFNAEGINIGLNLGKASGAGIPSHLHMHVLPRWIGDTNFMPTIAGTKAISFDLDEIYKKIHNLLR